MNHKAFTLIELLIVVAIIGILAAVGVVAYSGYTAAAKFNAVKSQHAEIVKYLSAEFQKCKLGHSKIFTDTWKTNQENCSIPADNFVLRASASDDLTAKMTNVYLGSGTSALIVQLKMDLLYRVQHHLAMVNRVAIFSFMLVMCLRSFHISMMMVISQIRIQILIQS